MDRRDGDERDFLMVMERKEEMYGEKTDEIR